MTFIPACMLFFRLCVFIVDGKGGSLLLCVCFLS